MVRGKMKKRTGSTSRTIGNDGGVEANTLAILDANDTKDTRDANEDRLQYLEAVRATSLVPENGTPPTNKMNQAIFRILRFGRTLELVMTSYKLLKESHKRFPRVYTSDPAAGGQCQLEVVDEAWSPFVFESDVASGEKETSGGNLDVLIDSSGFNKLIQELNGADTEVDTQEVDMEILRNMLLFLYLVNVLEADFTPRNCVYTETSNWSVLKESSLNLLLASRRVNYKLLMKDCMSTMCRLFAMTTKDADFESSRGTQLRNHDTAAGIGLVEMQKCACLAMKKLLIMIMELDASKKKAGLEGITTRGDGVRTQALEIIVDELTYDAYLLSTFLQVFDDPKWKLEIVLQYFSKYISKPSLRTRRPNVPPAEDSTTLAGILKILSNGTNARNVTKKIGADILQLLIGHGFLAWLALSSSQPVNKASEPKEGDSVTGICNSIVSSFSNLKKVDQKLEILPFGKEALFTAVTILKASS